MAWSFRTFDLSNVRVFVIEWIFLESVQHLVWYCISTLSDWFNKPGPLFHPLRNKTKNNRTWSHKLSRALRQLYAYAV